MARSEVWIKNISAANKKDRVNTKFNVSSIMSVDRKYYWHAR